MSGNLRSIFAASLRDDLDSHRGFRWVLLMICACGALFWGIALVSRSGQPAHQTEQSLKLDSTVIQRSHPLAMINGRPVGHNDCVVVNHRKFQVLEISRGTVLLQREDETTFNLYIAEVFRSLRDDGTSTSVDPFGQHAEALRP